MNYVEAKGEKIPLIGFGTWNLKGQNGKKAIKDAIEMGYRHIDTAQFYGNERIVGEAISESDVDRDKIFLTTKLWKSNLEYEKAKSSFEKSLSKLNTGYVDLLLIHWPVERVPVKETIRAMNEIQSADMVRHIGVSNFDVNQLKEAQKVSKTPILTDQVKYNPLTPKPEILQYCQKNDIILTAYSPLAKGRVIHNEKLSEIGKKYGKSAAQVALRWIIKHENTVAIPKAGSEKHRKDNIEIFDFELNKEEMKEIANL